MQKEPQRAVPEKAHEAQKRSFVLDLDSSSSYMSWFYQLLRVPQPLPTAPFAERELARKAKLFITILFYTIITCLITIVPALFLPDKLILFAALGTALSCVIGMVIARFNFWQFAFFFVILAFTGIIMIMIIGVRPHDATTIQTYNVFIYSELLAISLLEMRWAVLIIAISLSFFSLDMIFSPFTPELDHLMQGWSLVTMIIRPVVVQLLAVTVVGLWMAYANRAIKRADRAEMIAALEHSLSQQQAQVEHEKKVLESDIHQIVQEHVDVSKTQVFSHIPYPETKSLWPLVGVINTLRMRVLHEHEIEKKYGNLQTAIDDFEILLDQASEHPELPLPKIATRTEMDLVFPSLHRFHRAMYAYWRSQAGKR